MVAKKLKVSPSSVWAWRQRYRRRGCKGLEPATRGKPPTVFAHQHRRALRSIVTHGPRECGFDLDMWTVRMVQQALNCNMKSDFSLTTILRYLHQEGFSFQRPKKVAYQRNPAEVNRWLRRRLAGILVDACKRKARVFFVDESGFEMEMIRGGTWGKKGETPVVRRNGRRARVTTARAVSNRGDFIHNGFNTPRLAS